MSSPPASASEPVPSPYLTSTSVNGNLDLPSKRHSWASCQTDSPYTAGAGSIGASSSKMNSLLLAEPYSFSFSPDPREWGSDLSPQVEEPDDALHDPGIVSDNKRNRLSIISRGALNLGCLGLLGLGFLAVFLGYPIGAYVSRRHHRVPGLYTPTNSKSAGPAGQFHRGLIDEDTPKDVFSKRSWRNSDDELVLVFSDEFNTDGRSFYPGDDPYWEAVDLHYWATNNLEWYDPEAVSTSDGSLVIRFSQMLNHDLNFQGGMLSTWNKFCFTGGLIETSVSLPGVNNVMGLWPAIWTMGNLGRAGYGATLDGTWPYSYDACDVGTLPNQTLNGLPTEALVNGDKKYGDVLSFLPGQRLSRCTCDGESHPGPKHHDSTYVGRSAPEIDIFEAQMSGQPELSGEVSQSAQWAPFDAGYVWQNTSDNMIFNDPSITRQNKFTGSITQQATSVITKTDANCYELEQGCFSVYGFEYKPGFDDAYIIWISDNKMSWTLNAAGLGSDPTVQISARPIAQEPMYILVNLGMSKNFGHVDLDHLTFPVHMRVDYVRVYQLKHSINIGCSPKDFPTEDYITRYSEAYSNPNLTTWTGDFNQAWPRNSLVDGCS
ncbi:hypothetical protein ONZ45_g7216 [Pleurotus djamor]|nr:hypothetical protein ONZ45_g7216 [Pleurotus djamor]